MIPARPHCKAEKLYKKVAVNMVFISAGVGTGILASYVHCVSHYVHSNLQHRLLDYQRRSVTKFIYLLLLLHHVKCLDSSDGVCSSIAV